MHPSSYPRFIAKQIHEDRQATEGKRGAGWRMIAPFGLMVVIMIYHDDEDDGDTADGVLSGDNPDSVLLHQWPTCSFNTCICSELGWYRHRNDNEWPDGDN